MFLYLQELVAAHKQQQTERSCRPCRHSTQQQLAEFVCLPRCPVNCTALLSLQAQQKTDATRLHIISSSLLTLTWKLPVG